MIFWDQYHDKASAMNAEDMGFSRASRDKMRPCGPRMVSRRRRRTSKNLSKWQHINTGFLVVLFNEGSRLNMTASICSAHA